MHFCECPYIRHDPFDSYYESLGAGIVAQISSDPAKHKSKDYYELPW